MGVLQAMKRYQRAWYTVNNAPKMFEAIQSVG